MRNLTINELELVGGGDSAGQAATAGVAGAVGATAGKVAGSTLGGYVGGAVGMLAGPGGAAIGVVAGRYVGQYLGGAVGAGLGGYYGSEAYDSMSGTNYNEAGTNYTISNHPPALVSGFRADIAHLQRAHR